MKNRDTYADRLGERFDRNIAQISMIVNKCDKEGRGLNQTEMPLARALILENLLVRSQLESYDPKARTNPEYDRFFRRAAQIVRHNLDNGRRSEIVIGRELVTVEDARRGGLISAHIGDIIAPLTADLIADKTGIPFQIGLSGNSVISVYQDGEAEISGEGVALTDTPVDLSKCHVKPVRIGLAVPISREALTLTDSGLEGIVNDLMPLALNMAINKLLFTTESAIGPAVPGEGLGPFAGKLEGSRMLSSVPTFREFANMKLDVLKSGAEGQALRWIMTPSQKAIAEETLIAKGRMICEDDRICEVPVLTTNYIGEGHIGIGDWSYQPSGIFGKISLIIDPFSKARRDAVDVVLNADFGTGTIFDAAFILARVGAQ